MPGALNLSEELDRRRNEASRLAGETFRPAALALDRMNDPGKAIAPDSPFWPALRGAYSLRYNAAELPRQLGVDWRCRGRSWRSFLKSWDGKQRRPRKRAADQHDTVHERGTTSRIPSLSKGSHGHLRTTEARPWWDAGL